MLAAASVLLVYGSSAGHWTAAVRPMVVAVLIAVKPPP
jgi:hypothetical protein